MGSLVGLTSRFAFSSMNGCLPTSASSGELVYQLELPANASTLVSVSTTDWNVVVNVIAGPSSNCVGPLTCVASSDSVSFGGTEAVRVTNTGASPATWFVVVDLFANSSSMPGAFTISTATRTRPMGTNEVEPNDTRVLADATGQVLTSGASMLGTLGTSEADLFRINVASPGVLIVDVDAFTCPTNTQLRLLDSMANQLHTDSSSSVLGCKVLAANVQAGTYYLSLARSAPSAQATPYWITPTLLGSRSMEMEPNDTLNQANLVTPDQVICGAVTSVSDTSDSYVVSLAQTANLQLELFEPSAGATPTCETIAPSTRVELLSGAGLTLTTGQGNGRGACSRIERTALSAGTYGIRVVGGTYGYCLAVRLR